MTIDVSPDMLRRQVTHHRVAGPSRASARPSAPGSSSTASSTSDALFTQQWKLDQAAEAYRLFDTQTSGKGVFLL